MDVARFRSANGLILFLAILLSACGGGGGGNSTPPLQPPTSLQYPMPPAFVIKQAITPLTPTVVGQVASYSIAPALPVGLNIDSTTGVISGSPTTITPQTAYTVTAMNASGSTTANVTISVNDVAPSIAYQSPYYAFTANVTAQQTIKPTATGGAVVAWNVNPTLPPGLVLSATDGSISGTPTAAAAPASYVVTAANSGGQSTASLTIGVASAPLLDLGHSESVIFIRTTGSRVLSLDSAGHWVLQDFSSGTTLAAGESAYATSMNSFGFSQGRFTHLPVDLAGNTVIVAITDGVEVHSSVDGHLLATIPGQYSWSQLASDGSYITTGNSTALAVWTPSGQALLSRQGDYSKALTFSAPGTVQIALGAAGQNAIETISVATAASSVSPTFMGTFNSWFVDGARFLSTQGNTVLTYSSAAAQQDITQLTGTDALTGQGNWFWTYSSTLNIYQVGASNSPAFSAHVGDVESLAFPSGSTIGIPSYTQGVTVIDLSGTTPVSANYSVPIAYLSTYAATSSTAWLIGNVHGVVLDGASIGSQPRFLTQGQAWSIVAGTSYVSVATAAGRIFTFDATTDALVSTLNFSSSQLAASSSGTVLAALANTNDYQYETDRTVNIYSLPSGTLVNSFPGTVNSTPLLLNITLSGSGTVLGEVFYPSGSGCYAEALPVTGGTPLWCDNTAASRYLQLSPDGTLVAASNLQQSGASTNLFQNGTLTTAVPGWGIGWLDNARLLGFTQATSTAAVKGVIYDPMGNVLATPPIPDMLVVQPVTANSVYTAESNNIVSLTTGANTWASGDPPAPGVGPGAVSGSQVVFESGSLVLAEPY